MTHLINTSNPDGPWLRAIDAWSGLAIPGSKADTCTMQIYAGLGVRPRNFYLSVDAAATPEFKAKYSQFVNPALGA